MTCEICGTVNDSLFRRYKSFGRLCRRCFNIEIAKGVNHKGGNNPNFGRKLKNKPRYRFNRKSFLNLIPYLYQNGIKNPNWNGGISSRNMTLRGTVEYKQWRINVLRRDRFTCQVCHIKGIKLHAHHIKPFSIYPELRYDIENGITLCINCHKLTDTYKRTNVVILSAINP